MTVLPDDFQIGKPKCNSDDLIPILVILYHIARKSSGPITWTFDLESEIATDKPPAKERKTIWHELRSRYPKEEAFWDWLNTYQPKKEEMNWPQALDSFKSVCRKKDINPINLLEQALPNWDGKSPVDQSEVKLTDEGIPPLLAKFIIPGLIELLKQTDKAKAERKKA